MKRKERAAGYPRVSDENLKDSPTLDSQEKAIREYIEKHGYDFEEKHMYPEAMTAYIKLYHERSVFMEMISAAKRREFDVLVVTEFSRLSRRQIEQAIIIDMLNKYGIRVESITENFDDSAISIFMRNVFVFIAEVEREKTLSVETIIAGIKKKLKNLYTLAQDATDDDTLDSLKALMHDLERQKHEAEAMLYEVAEEEETISNTNATFPAWIFEMSSKSAISLESFSIMPQASRWLFLSQDHGLVESGNARPYLFQRPIAGAVAQPVTELDCAGECLPTGEFEMPSVVEAYIREHLRQ